VYYHIYSYFSLNYLAEFYPQNMGGGLHGTIMLLGSQGSSVSIVSGYGLDNWAIDVRSPAEAREFSSSLCDQTGSGAYPASCTMGTEGPFPRSKVRSGRDTDHSPPSSVEVLDE
jgi:hypothetical protein